MKTCTRYDHKCTFVLRYTVLFSLQILIKLDPSQHFFEKYSNAKFHENPSSRSQVIPCGRTGQTDRHNDANSRLWQFCEGA